MVHNEQWKINSQMFLLLIPDVTVKRVIRMALGTTLKIHSKYIKIIRIATKPVELEKMFMVNST